MNMTKHNSSQRWVNLKQQYAQWRQRAAERKITRHAAEAACGGFGMLGGWRRRQVSTNP